MPMRWLGWRGKRPASSNPERDLDDELRRPEPVDAATVMRRARRLRFRARPGAMSDLLGAYLGVRSGEGLTFSELRPYEPGDEVRHIDWNVTARQGRPYVRRFVEERALTLQLLVDISASLRFGRDGQSKADRAAQAAALLASAAIQAGDRVGLRLVTDRVEAKLSPGGGLSHLARILRLLVMTPASSKATRLASALSLRPGRRRGRRTMLVLLSDFRVDLDREPAGLWTQAARQHDVLAIRLVDPREEKLPKAGLVALEDAETAETRLVDTGSRATQRTYAEQALRRRERFRNWCQQFGILSLELSTEEDPIQPLTRFFRSRDRRWTRNATP